MRVEWTFNLDRAVKMSGKYDQRRAHSETMALTLLFECMPFPTGVQSAITGRREVRINCTSQAFAKYLVERCNAGYLNCFRELDARIVPDPPPSIILFRTCDEERA